jgi:hypothetical protein
MDYVKDIRSNEVIVQCETTSLQKALELPGTVTDEVAIVPFRDRSELAALLTWLQSLDVPFLDAGPGWTPAAVFQSMREEGWFQVRSTGSSGASRVFRSFERSREPIMHMSASDPKRT